MTLSVSSTVQTGVATVAKSVVATTAEDWALLQQVFQRATNLWPDAPASIKELADIITEGKPLQDYYAQANTVKEEQNVKSF